MAGEKRCTKMKQRTTPALGSELLIDGVFPLLFYPSTIFMIFLKKELYCFWVFPCLFQNAFWIVMETGEKVGQSKRDFVKILNYGHLTAHVKLTASVVVSCIC